MSQSDSPGPWPIESSEVVHEYPIFRVRRDRLRSPRTGETHDFYIVDPQQAVVVVALTPDDEIVMVEQFRHGVREATLEMPGGILDGDDPADAALRELREETGYDAESVRLVGSLQTNPSWETTLVHVAVATGARRAGPRELDDGEDTRVRPLPRTRVGELIAAGEIRNSIMVAAYHLLERGEEDGARGSRS